MKMCPQLFSNIKMSCLLLQPMGKQCWNPPGFSLEKITGIFPSISAPSVCSGSGVTSDWPGEQHNFQIRSFECILAAGLLAEWWNPAVWLPKLFQETQTDLGPRPKSLQQHLGLSLTDLHPSAASQHTQGEERPREITQSQRKYSQANSEKMEKLFLHLRYRKGDYRSL